MLEDIPVRARGARDVKTCCRSVLGVLHLVRVWVHFLKTKEERTDKKRGNWTLFKLCVRRKTKRTYNTKY